jgi:hypothetical protein
MSQKFGSFEYNYGRFLSESQNVSIVGVMPHDVALKQNVLFRSVETKKSQDTQLAGDDES